MPTEAQAANQYGIATTAGIRRTLTRIEVEEWVDARLARSGAEGINRLRDQTRQRAPTLQRESQLTVLVAMIGAALSTRDDSALTSPATRARAKGVAYDRVRIKSFARMARSLGAVAPDVLPLLPADQHRRALLPFYGAYFSNDIEGTEFTLNEAANIVFEQAIPQRRPLDAHDVRAGAFQQQSHQAGSTIFVAPNLVDGALLRGFDEGTSLSSPFACAVFLMFLVSEVRIIIPPVYRLNYLAALKAARHTDDDNALIVALAFARRRAGCIDFSDRRTAGAGVRLVLP